MDVTHDLTQMVKDPVAAHAVIKQIQTSMDELVLANEQLIAAADKSNEVATQYQAEIITANKTMLDLTDLVKAVHTVLGTKKDLWKDDAELNEMQAALSTFVVSGGAIRAGILQSMEVEENADTL